MKRIPSWSAVAGALIVALSVMSLTPTSNAQPYGYYNGGGYYNNYPYKNHHKHSHKHNHHHNH